MIICKYKILSDVLIAQNSANLSHSHGYTPTGTVSSSLKGDEKGFYAGSADSYEQIANASYTNYKGVTITLGQSPSSGIPYQYAARERSLAALIKWTSSGTVSSSFSAAAQSTDSDGTTESRPNNFTVKIWKRIS